ncbi:MAG TPA: hypothetical protein VK578_05930 [Edaphobacter sp.]|nr:hypothetical protein [Edaphobacter sp.]
MSVLAEGIGDLAFIENRQGVNPAAITCPRCRFYVPVDWICKSPEARSAVFKGYQHFSTPIPLPILAIMGYPQNKGPNFHAETPKSIAAAAAADANQVRQIDAFERGQPTAHVVRIADANHYIFISNETQVLIERDKFLVTLS